MLARLAAPFHDAYPDIDLVFYDRAGKLVASDGSDHPQVTAPVDAATGNASLAHGCETALDAPAAISVMRAIGTAGSVLACLPLDGAYFANAQAKLGVELAFGDHAHARYTSADFPHGDILDADPEGTIANDGDRAWAVASFVPAPLAETKASLRFACALDVTDIRSIVRRNLLVSLLLVGAATVISIYAGWRLASRMSRALSRVNVALRKLEQQEYTRVDVMRTGDELEDLAEGFNRMVDGLQERDKLRATMGKYMTAQVMSHVLANEIELGGKALEVTILFCDLRDFTTLSENKTPHDVVALLNEYFTEMVEVIHDQGGVVDKYIGDNIMAVFGAPVSRPDDAIHAVGAAVRMRAALAALNVRFAERGLAQLRFGIGLHTGEVVAGNIGSPQRMEYTVIGDAVNLASRLEGATKQHGVDVLISEATYELAQGAIAAARIDEIMVKDARSRSRCTSVRGMAVVSRATRASAPTL